MSSNLFIVNWTAEVVTPTLNTLSLSSISVSAAKFDYFPYQTTVPRDASQPGTAGIWGDVNALVVLPNGGGSQIYNELADPAGAAPNTDLFLWIFPEFLVFSQLDQQLGSRIFPT